MSRDRKLFLSILTLTFLSILLLNFLTPLLADDYRYLFSIATQQRITSVWQIFPSMAAHALTMNGRVIPHFFDQLFLMLPSPIFKLLNAAVYILLLLGMYRLAKGQREAYDWKLLMMIAGAVFVLPPIFGQPYLWQTGSVSYLWRDALAVWVFGRFADATFRGRPVRGFWQAALLALASVAVCNSTENATAAILFLMAFCIAWLLIAKQKVPAALPVALACGAVTFAALILAPSGVSNLKYSASGLNQLFENYQRALSMWLSHALWPSVAYIALFFWAVANPAADRKRLTFSFALFLGSLVSNFAMTATYYYPLRASVITVNLIVMAASMTLTELGQPGRAWATRVLALALGAVFALQTVSALPYAYNRYRMAQAREAQVLEQRNSGVKNVTTFGILGKSPYDAFYDLHELTDLPDYFPNVYFAKYYGLDTVVVDRFEN